MVEKTGRGGSDYLCMLDFITAVRNKTETPIDVYDAVTWSIITDLSEKSVETESHLVEFQYFTKGKWKTCEPVGVKLMRLTFLLFLSAFSVAKAQSDNNRLLGEVTIVFEIDKTRKFTSRVRFGEPPQFAIWLENQRTATGRETLYNHGMKEPSKYDWEDGINSKASIQIGRLPAFF